MDLLQRGMSKKVNAMNKIYLYYGIFKENIRNIKVLVEYWFRFLVFALPQTANLKS